VLDGMGLRFWLTNGTALAARREGDWIPWDDDVDLDVYAEEMHPLHQRLRKTFLDLGFIVRDVYDPKSGKMSLFREGEKTALRGLYLKSGSHLGEYRLRKRYKYPRRFYETPGTIVFKGMTFQVPSPIEEFLVFVYGDNWRKPMRSDNEREYSMRRIRR
jgi:hypothetical protein